MKKKTTIKMMGSAMALCGAMMVSPGVSAATEDCRVFGYHIAKFGINTQNGALNYIDLNSLFPGVSLADKFEIADLATGKDQHIPSNLANACVNIVFGDYKLED